MLLRELFVFIFLVYICDAENQTFIDNLDDDPEDFGEMVARLSGGVGKTRPDYPWMSFIVNKLTSQFNGYAVAISVKWVLTLHFNVENIPMDKILVYSDSTDPTNYKTGKKHTLRQLIMHEEADHVRNALAVMRVCPRMPESSVISLPTPCIVYSTSYQAQINKWSFGLQTYLQATKYVGEQCECDETNMWDPNTMFCLANDPFVFGQGNDYYVPVTIDGKIAGFLMHPQGAQELFWGEQVIDLSRFRNWIYSKTKL